MSLLSAVLFFYEWGALYIYYASEEFGFVGCLVAAFGCSAMAIGCGSDGTSTRGLYGNIEQNAIGIALLTTIDMIFTPARASDLATDAIIGDNYTSTEGQGTWE